MISEKTVCSEQFCVEITQFTMHLWDFLRKMCDILAVSCHVSHTLRYFIDS